MRSLFYILFFFLFSAPLWAADYYWKGGSGNFNDPNMWWVGSIGGATAFQSPQSSDNVFFKASVFSNMGDVITIDNYASCFSMEWDPLLAHSPILRCTNPATNLDIYGNLSLCSNMVWDFDGNARLKSVEPAGVVHTIYTAGVHLLVTSLEIAPTNMVEYRLLDNLYIDDPSTAVGNLSGGSLFFVSGYFNTNGQGLRADNFSSVSNNPNRQLNIQNSRIEVTRNDHFGGDHLAAWNLDFNKTSNNYQSFQAGGSHLIISNLGTSWVFLGTGLRYDSITFARQYTTPTQDAPTLLTYLSSTQDTCNYVASYRRVQGGNIITDQLHLYPTAHWAVTTTYLEQIITHVTCGQFPIIGQSGMYARSAGAGWWGSSTLIKRSTGTLTMNQVILGSVKGDISNGSNYVANNSADRGGNQNITINGTAGRNLYFRDSGDQTWHTLANWQEAGSIPATCLPTPFDNVYFDALSFPNGNKKLLFDGSQIAYSKGMYWMSGLPTTAQIRLNTILFAFGTLQWEANMSGADFSGSGYLMLCSPNQDSIITNGANNTDIYVTLDNYADYHIHGNYRGRIYAGSNSRIRMKADTLSPSHGTYFSHADFDGTQIEFSNDAYHLSGTVNYTGNATIHLMAGGAYHIRYLNTYPYIIAHIGSKAYLWGNVSVSGDFHLLEDGFVSIGLYGSSTGTLNVVGGLNGAVGNLQMERGSNLVFGNYYSGTNNTFAHIAGDMDLLGDCQKTAAIYTHDGNSFPNGFDVDGNVSINYGYFKGIKNVSAAPNITLSANNTADGGNNSNINFIAAANNTFYWRAHNTDPSDFVGNWSDPGHWTTNPANLTGDAICVPTAFDDVVFDNLSFSPTSNGCTVAANAFCRDVLFNDAARFVMGTVALTCRNFTVNHSNAILESTANNNGNIILSGSIALAANMPNMRYRGVLTLTGSGNISSNGTQWQILKLALNNPSGVWHLQDDLYLSNDWAGTNGNYTYSGELDILAGALYTNSHELTISSYFRSTVNTHPRALHLGSSVVTHRNRAPLYINGSPDWLWNINATNFTLTFNSDAQINFLEGNLFNVPNTLMQFYMGNLAYPNVSIKDVDQPIELYGNASYQYLELEGNFTVAGNNTMDSLRLEGGYYYRFAANSVQTLRAPHGKITANGTTSSFIGIESASAGTPFTLLKPYGDAFCLDFVKVKDCIGAKESNIALIPSAPIDYQAIHPFLKFETGINSDNINNSATGIWDFSLPIFFAPNISGSTTIALCALPETATVALPIIGSEPYIVSYSWTDNLGGSGSTADTLFYDDDADAATPFMHYVSFPVGASSIVYTLNMRSLRCGEESAAAPIVVTVQVPTPDVLVAVDRATNCSLNNEDIWYTFLDNIDNRPILSLNDKASVADMQALGNVNIDVYFDATVQFWNNAGLNTPYLQRHWRVTPAQNGPAKVRLYFTQTEIDELATHCYYGSLDVFGGDIRVRKFDDGVIGSASHSVIPHTVLSWDALNSAPFSSTAGVYVIEFEVNSFSAFIIEPTPNALLATNLLQFDAFSVNKQQSAQLNWSYNETDKSVFSYTLQHATDALHFSDIHRQTALNEQNTANYYYTDLSPNQGTNYYRLLVIETNGNQHYSPVRAVEILGYNTPFALFPNPIAAGSVLTIQSSATSATTLQFHLLNTLGQSLHHVSLPAIGQGSFLWHVPNDITPGTYYLQITDDTGNTQYRKINIL